MEYILVANTLKVKRSSVQGKVPLTSDLQLGELAVNTYDGKLYLKKDVGGVESIVDVSAGLDATGVLQLLKTVDGVGSGLDADLLGGLASSSANTASTIVSRDSSGNFSAGTITAALSGNASTATTLQTARTINGVSFNGSANITIADSTKLPLSGGTMTGAIIFAAGQTWPTFNQNTTGSAANISNTGTVTLASATESNSVYITAPTYSTDKPVKLLNFDWYGNIFSIGNIRSGSVASSGFGLYYTTGGVQTEIARFGTTGSFNTIGAITQNGSQVLTAGNYNSYSPTLTGGGASGTWGINVTGNAATVTNGLYSTGSYADPAWITSINYSKLTGTIPTWNQNTTGSAAKWTTARTLSFTGDATGSGSVDGSTNVATALTLANSGVAAGTYTKITVDAKGRATSGTTLADTDIPALDASKITTGVFDPARLPSYVDDVLEYANLASFPTTGTTGKIYVALDTNKTYRWSGTVYVYITSGAVDSVAGKTGVVILTNADVGLSNVENKSSATIRGEITSTNVTSALGFTPYNSTNPSGYTTNTGTVTSIVAGTGLSGGTITTTGTIALANTAVTAGSYTATNITVDAQGRITAASNGASALNPWVKITGATTLTDKSRYIVSSPTAPYTITLPSSPSLGSEIWLIDGADWSINNVTVARNGATIEGLAEDLTLNVKGTLVQLLHDGTTWQVAANLGPKGETGPQGPQGPQGIQGIQGIQGVSSYNQSLNTSNNVQFNSLGVNTAASGTAGEIRATGNIVAGYSDDRLKTRLGKITGALEKIKSLSSFYYEPNATAIALGYIKKREVGISAQEVEKVLPEIVEPAPIDSRYLTVHYDKLIPILIAAINEQQLQIDSLMEALHGNS